MQARITLLGLIVVICFGAVLQILAGERVEDALASTLLTAVMALLVGIGIYLILKLIIPTSTDRVAYHLMVIALVPTSLLVIYLWTL